MLKKKLSFILILIILIMPCSSADHINEGAIRDMEASDLQAMTSNDVEHNLKNLEKAGRIGELKPEQIGPYMDKLSDASLQQLKKDQLIFKDSSGQPNINKVKDWNKLDKAARDEALSEVTKKPVVTENPVEGKVVGDGVEFPFIGFLKVGETSVNNCIACIYDGKKLIFKHADSVVTNKSASTNIDNFEGFAGSFKVEKADSLLSGCLRFDSIKETSFSIFDGKVTADIKNGNNASITDCSYTQSQFESNGNGSVEITKDSKPKYEIREGILKCKYQNKTDKIEAQANAAVEIDNCFSCMAITPAGTYFYSDADIRKDFSINVPKESSAYRLCLKKNAAQQFQSYNGMVDFVGKKIELDGIVNYLRYPLKNSQISSLLGSFVYRGLKDVKTVLNYDKGMLFLNDVNIQNTINNRNQITITRPNNFYTIEEIELDGKIHRVASLSLLQKEDATQSIVSNYHSDSLDAGVKITDGILIQQAGESKVTILPPGHPEINSFLR